MIPRISIDLIESMGHDMKENKQKYFEVVEKATINDPLIGHIIGTLSSGIDNPSGAQVSMYMLYSMLMRADECASMAKENGDES